MLGGRRHGWRSQSQAPSLNKIGTRWLQSDAQASPGDRACKRTWPPQGSRCADEGIRRCIPNAAWKNMPRIPRQNAPTRPSLPSNDAKSFQSVVAKETRMKQANDEQDSAQANLDERDLAASASKPRPGRPSVR
jgi:hypothetical protein